MLYVYPYGDDQGKINWNGLKWNILNPIRTGLQEWKRLHFFLSLSYLVWGVPLKPGWPHTGRSVVQHRQGPPQWRRNTVGTWWLWDPGSHPSTCPRHSRKNHPWKRSISRTVERFKRDTDEPYIWEWSTVISALWDTNVKKITDNRQAYVWSGLSAKYGVCGKGYVLQSPKWGVLSTTDIKV